MKRLFAIFLVLMTTMFFGFAAAAQMPPPGAGTGALFGYATGLSFDHALWGSPYTGIFPDYVNGGLRIAMDPQGTNPGGLAASSYRAPDVPWHLRGTSAPSGVCENGSTYSVTGAGPAPFFYVCEAGAWVGK